MTRIGVVGASESLLVGLKAAQAEKERQEKFESYETKEVVFPNNILDSIPFGACDIIIDDAIDIIQSRMSSIGEQSRYKYEIVFKCGSDTKAVQICKLINRSASTKKSFTLRFPEGDGFRCLRDLVFNVKSIELIKKRSIFVANSKQNPWEYVAVITSSDRPVIDLGNDTNRNSDSRFDEKLFDRRF